MLALIQLCIYNFFFFIYSTTILIFIRIGIDVRFLMQFSYTIQASCKRLKCPITNISLINTLEQVVSEGENSLR
jgi:hypothetical protein